MAAESDGSGIRTTEVVFDIIKSITERGGADLAEIAEDVDRSKSTLYTHLSTLVSLGYVRNEEGRYQLGLAFLEWGTYARSLYEVYQWARPKIKQIAIETGERVQLMVEDDGRGIYLYRAEGHRAIPAAVRLGTPRFLHLSSAGKAILAHLPSDEIEGIIDRWGLPTKTPNTVVDQGSLKDELDTVRERGYAVNRQESIQGSWSIGVPIRHDTRLLGAVSLSGPTHRIRGDDGIQSDLLSTVRSTVEEIEIAAQLED